MPLPGTLSRRTAFAIPIVLALAAVSCGRPGPEPTSPDAPPAGEPSAPQWFEDVTEAWGLDFTHDPGPTGTYFMPQSMGSGAAVFDADGDGLLDVYLLQFGGPASKSPNRLFLQSAPGKFRDATEGSGLGIAGHSHGVAVGDVNNDGKPDLVVSHYQGLRLLLNAGGGKFVDATEASGLANPLWGMSCAFLDYDRDGWLDLVVVNYLDYDPNNACRSPEGVQDFCGPNAFRGALSKVFRNRGVVAGKGETPARVAFEDTSFASNIGRVPGPGLGVAVADFDGDGWPDIFVANDGQPNRLWVNKRDGSFSEEAVSRGVAYTAMGKAFAGMGVAVGDTKNTGMLDLYVTHLGSEMNNLWRQGPRGQFRDKTVEAGLSNPKWRGTGFGTLMADFDNNGSLDIAVGNGRVFRGGSARNTALGFWETYAEKNQLFANDGTGKFRDISPANPAFCDYWNVARGLVAADFDNDGGIDLLVAPIGSKARVFRNVAPERGNWLKVRALDLGRDAHGAEVRVKAGGKEFFRVVSPAESYLCSGPATLHFGLGAATIVEGIEVTWLVGEKGTREVFPGGPAGRTVVVRKGEGKSP
jgi:hypothetical protein